MGHYDECRKRYCGVCGQRGGYCEHTKKIKKEFEIEYLDSCKAGFQGTYEDYLDYRSNYGKENVPISKDKEYLEFIYNRLVHKYDENNNYDYMLNFKKIIDRM